MSASLIGLNGTSIATNANPIPVQLSTSFANRSPMAFAQQDPMVDSFERLRVSEPEIAFEYMFVNGVNATYWDSAVYGVGTFLPTVVALGAAAPAAPNNDVGTNLNTTTASLTGAWIQSLYHVRYAPALSSKAHITFNPTVAQANQTVRVGVFTDQGTFPSNAGDGVYFEMVGTSLQVTRRYLTGGGVGAVEQVLQANWNLDKCNGTGTSGFNLDVTKAIHLVIEWQWLGVGNVRIGFETGATGVVWAHDFINVNVTSAPWCRTGTLPIRAEIFTTGVVAQPGILKMICCSVLQEGLLTRRPWRYHSADSGTAIRTILATAALGAYYPLMSIRAAITNDFTKRALIVPTKATINLVTLGTGPTGYKWALIYAPSALPATATFAVIGSELCQVDIAATPGAALTGGIVVAGGMLSQVINSNNVIDLKYLEDNLIKIGQNAAGGLTIAGAGIWTLAVTPMGAAATAAPTLFATLDWKELC
jgi:hypothetical protein